MKANKLHQNSSLYHPEIYFEDAAKCSTRQAERSKIIQKLLVTNTTDSSDTPILALAKPAPSQASSSSTGEFISKEVACQRNGLLRNGLLVCRLFMLESASACQR